MTTLQGEELFKYLDDLEELLKKAQPQDKDPTLSELLHKQMCELIDAEKRFLTEYHQKNGVQPQLAIALNGLLTIETLTADLENICKLGEFKDIAEKYQRKTIDESQLKYNQVTREEWHKELKTHDKRKLNSKVGFQIRETEHGIFELEAMEEVYKEGYDKFCKENPVLIRGGTIGYHVVMNDRLLAGVKGSYYMPEKITSLEQIAEENKGNTAQIKYDNSKTKRIEKLAGEIRKIDDTIKNYQERGVLYDEQFDWQIQVLKTVLELEKNHPGKFRWRQSWDTRHWYYIYKKGLLDTKIALIRFQGFRPIFHGSHLWVYKKTYKSYLQTLKKMLPQDAISVET